MNRGALWALLFGNFCIGAGVMVVPGTLNDISDSLAVSPATAGQLITVGALLMCVGAPVFAALVAGWDRRRLLALTMLWFGLLHMLAAQMPSFATLMPVRVLTLVSPAIFTPQAAACVGLLVPPAQRAQAVAFIFLGWSAASVLGTPMATWISGHWGWQASFIAIGALSVLAAVLVWRAMPGGIKPPALTRTDWAQVLGSPWLMGVVAVTAMQGMGQFMLLSYLAPVLKMQIGADANTLSVVWLWFGVCGMVGNLLVSRHVGWLGPAGTSRALMILMAVSLALWPLAGSLWVVLVVMLPWGLSCFAVNSAQQARLLALSPALASASVALNTSAIHVGQAFGAGIGGVLLASGNDWGLTWGGAGIVLGAVALSSLLMRGEGRMVAATARSGQ